MEQLYSLSLFLKAFISNLLGNTAQKSIRKSKIESFLPRMSTTRSQKRRNNQQESTESVSEGLVSPKTLKNVGHSEQDASIAGPSSTKSPRVDNSLLESLRASLKDEITSEFKTLLVESQKELARLLKHKTGEKVRKMLMKNQKMKQGVSTRLQNLLG